MCATPLFRGCATALVTPFHQDGTLDEPALQALIQGQLDAGIDAIVLLGTTGEASTLNMQERERVISIGVETVQGHVPVIVGTGSNNTRYAIDYARQAKALGADAQLTVTPYYNKATQRGLIEHYNAILDSCDLPMLLYSVPSRTGVNLLPQTLAKLCEHPNIIGLKEASGDLSLVADILQATHGKLPMYSGNDDIIVPMMAMGAVGVISVVANIVPARTRAIAQVCLEEQYNKARVMQLELLPLIRALFAQVNPIPIKAALSMQRLIENALRLPLTPMDAPHRAQLHDILNHMELI